MDKFEEREMFFSRRSDKTIVSRTFRDQGGMPLRIISKVMDSDAGLEFASVQGELVLRRTAAGRQMIKATIIEDSRRIKTLTFQRYDSRSGPLDETHFSFVGREIDRLIEFIAGVKTMPLEGETKRHVSDDELRDILLDRAQLGRLLVEHENIFLEVAQREDLKRDLVAVGYRRKQLEYFRRLVYDFAFFEDECQRSEATPEALWQQFFERNTWIFGYGLSYQFLTGLDQRRLEQVVRGHDVGGTGKRTDALMKTRGLVSSLCFVEIKRHDTALLARRPYRPEAWAPSEDLSGGVAQVQATVQAALENIGRKLMPVDRDGDPTGETLFNVAPRSFLVIGRLSEFQTDAGVRELKYRSFELYRRNVARPEIITFDELLERAQFIVDQSA